MNQIESRVAARSPTVSVSCEHFTWKVVFLEFQVPHAVASIQLSVTFVCDI